VLQTILSRVVIINQQKSTKNEQFQVGKKQALIQEAVQLLDDQFCSIKQMNQATLRLVIARSQALGS